MATRVERPVTREKHTVSLPGPVVGEQKQKVAGRTLGPEQAWIERWAAKLPPLSKDARDRIALLFLAAAPDAVAS